jgi:hypothetical protein
MDEAEFVGELRKAHWGESAIEQELVGLRAYKAQFVIKKSAPATPEIIEERLEAEAIAEPEKRKSRYWGVLGMRKQKREREAELESDEDE